jgi:hypothetical protein
LNHPHGASPSNRHYADDGATIFKQACGRHRVRAPRLAPYRSGRIDPLA